MFSNNALSIERDGNWLLDTCTPITKYRDLATGELKKDPPSLTNDDAFKLSICLSFVDGIAYSHFYTGRQKGNKPHVCAVKVGYNESIVATNVMFALIKAINIKDSVKFYKSPAAAIVTEVMQANYPCK